MYQSISLLWVLPHVENRMALCRTWQAILAAFSYHPRSSSLDTTQIPINGTMCTSVTLQILFARPKVNFGTHTLYCVHHQLNIRGYRVKGASAVLVVPSILVTVPDNGEFAKFRDTPTKSLPSWLETGLSTSHSNHSSVIRTLWHQVVLWLIRANNKIFGNIGGFAWLSLSKVWVGFRRVRLLLVIMWDCSNR